MKSKISILGSTGSIGKNLIKILIKNKDKFKVNLLTANKNYNELLKQSKLLNVKNLIITDKDSYLKIIKLNKNKNINIYNNFKFFNKIFKSKNDYVMSSITGLDGLEPTVNIIKYTKKIAIANKESIICGWNLIQQKLKKHNTKFIPVDSEHFSIWYALKNNDDNLEKIFITASGGPFLNLPLKRFKNINIAQALNHPNWKMGKKITIDSSTMMNKVFEVIEAKKIFNIEYNKISILTHPSSYIHAIIKFDNGLIKLIAHETDMKIPIFNTIYEKRVSNKDIILQKKINLKKLNHLNFKSINLSRFPLVKILNQLSEKNSLFETILVSANDELVSQFLNKKIRFIDISKKLLRIVKYNDFKKYKKISPNNIKEIIELSNYVRLKINSKSI